MGIIPLNKVERVEFCESHWPVWSTNATMIGLTAAQGTAFKNLTTAARVAYDAAQAAKQAYRAAVTAQDAAISAAISGPGGAADLLRVIKGFAELSNNPDSVYSLAQIPPPATPVPLPAPGTPEKIAVTLEPSGAVTITWEATDAAASSGAYFNITRKLPGQTSFTLVGGSPGSTTESRRMSFTDFTIPTSAASAGAQYIIQGRRGNRMGEMSEAVVVQFGVDGLGAGVVGGLKMAA